MCEAFFEDFTIIYRFATLISKIWFACKFTILFDLKIPERIAAYSRLLNGIVYLLKRGLHWNMHAEENIIVLEASFRNATSAEAANGYAHTVLMAIASIP